MATTFRRLVVSLDGTWNNAYRQAERDDGTHVLKPSNPLKLVRSVLPHDPQDGTTQLSYYDIGVGSLGRYPGLSNRLLSTSDKILGGAWGAGFEANIEQAATFLAHNYREGDAVFVFGFSRGASEARGLTRFLDWMGGLPTKRDAYFLPLFFGDYVRSAGRADPAATTTSSGHGPRDPLQPIEITMLGVWDTVMALGSRFRATTGTSVESRSFHIGPAPAECVRHARHALAVDEQRYDFRPEIWRRALDGQSLVQRWFPGVHSNVGGGYLEDGLANLSFRWMLREAEALGLAVDSDYAKFFKPYPQARQHRSRTLIYQVGETLLRRRDKGIRPIAGHGPEANLDLDKSVIHRMVSDPGEPHFDQLTEPYRPDNVLRFLAEQPSLSSYLASIDGLAPEFRTLPPDVAEKVEKLRASRSDRGGGA